jgi:hypothetical protein
MNVTSAWSFGWTQLLTIIGFLITIGITITGFRTFDRWKRERLEEKKIDIAFDMLSIAYEEKYIFDQIQRPMSYGYEWEDMPTNVGETENQRNRRGPFYATLKRINQNKDFFERAWKLQPRCMAVLGLSVEDIFLLMHRARREIEVAAQTLASNHGMPPKLIDELEHDVWSRGGSDRVGQKLTEFRERTEKLCRPLIDREFNVLVTHSEARNPIARARARLRNIIGSRL